MTWNEQTQARFDALRLRDLTGKLTAAEETELAQLMRELEASEQVYLEPAVEKLRQEQSTLQQKLLAVQSDNEELARLLHQQEQLAAEARQWLREFQERHRQIQKRYSHLTGETLSAA